MRRGDLRAVRIKPFSANPTWPFKSLHLTVLPEMEKVLERWGVEDKVLVLALSSKLFSESTQCWSLPHWTLEKMVPTKTCVSHLLMGTNEWIQKLWYIYTMEFYAAERKKELIPFMTAWMELESIMLSEISQVVKDKYHMKSPLSGT